LGGPQVPPLHLGALGEQSAGCRHWTQTGPLSPPALQYGVTPEQSALLAHWTHRFRLQAGVAVPAQSELLVHCTHCCVVGSQRFREFGQSADDSQPTHAAVLLLQIAPLPL
jgi:hypothetical protein